MEYQAADKLMHFKLCLARMNLESMVLNDKNKSQEPTTVRYHFCRAQNQAKLSSILFMRTHTNTLLKIFLKRKGMNDKGK